MYRAGILHSERLPVPVIVVGNLFIGGTGKTPLTIALARHFQSCGFSPAVVSRGYGGQAMYPRAVYSHTDPALVGDEPVLIASACGCPVWIGRNRAEAARQLLVAHPDCDLILCDDGLQHYGLFRDVEIEVVDERGYGNGLLLPAGPLREPVSRRVDAKVINGSTDAAINGPRAASRNARQAAPIFGMMLEPVCIYRLDAPAAAVDVASLQRSRLHAVAGTGNPGRFFATVRALGLHPTVHAYPDHHVFQASDLDYLDCDAVLMTEKDAVKCRRFGRADLYALRVEARLQPAFFDLVRAAVPHLGPGRSPH
jgi:tetraacyldisaccharide 4'-kinase